MSEHIKTGNDIEHEIYRASETRNGCVDELLHKQWVSLSELKKYSGYTVDAALDAMEKT